MMGVEPMLSMMYFYGEAYTKVFYLQALATELHSHVPLRWEAVNKKLINW